MDQVDVIAVVGTCAPQRARYAERLATATGRMLVPARRLAISPDPVDEAAALVPWADGPAGAVVEMPGAVLVSEVRRTLGGPGAATRLSRVVCVADAVHLLDDLRHDTYAYRPPPPWRRLSVGQHLAHALLTVTQLEGASVVTLVGWQSLATDRLSTMTALLSHLNPQAHLDLDADGARPWWSDAVGPVVPERPGWVALLQDDLRPRLTDRHVDAFRYQDVRPLHPQRLERVLDDRIEPGGLGTVIRSAGFCRLATRAEVVARWDHVGRMIAFTPVGRDDQGGEVPALGQDLAVIGLDLDQDGLTAALDGAALTDDELAAGPQEWARWPDPQPAWWPAPDPAD